MKAVVLFSGGADSFLQYTISKKEYTEVIPLFIAHDNARLVHDYKAAVSLISEEHLRTVMVTYPEPHGVNAFVPFRNYRMVFDALTEIPDADAVLVAGIQDDRVGDKTPEAFSALTALLNASGLEKNVLVKSDLFQHTKGMVYKSIMQYAEETDTRPIPLSCYSTKEERCGHCKACIRTAIGIVNGVDLFWRDLVPEEHVTKVVLRELRNSTPFGLTRELLERAARSNTIQSYLKEIPETTNRWREVSRFHYLSQLLLG
jgi:7-cyano-7-deazaguanine synthase in queuosine biosynthesis